MLKYVIGLIFCIFMGITAISVGVGAAYPPINLVAQPAVCPNGEMVYQQSVINPLPGRTYIQAAWTCDGQPINGFLLALVAGSFYGLLLFAMLWAIIKVRQISRERPMPCRMVPGDPRDAPIGLHFLVVGLSQDFVMHGDAA